MAKTIKSKWESYESEVLPKNAGPTQRKECKRAFYAGAASLFHFVTSSVGDNPNEEPTDAEMAMLTEIDKELKEFLASIKVKEDIPKTLDEAIAYLKETLLAEDVEAITKMEEGDIFKLHHSLGQHLRNEWGLWSGGPLHSYFKGIGIFHADDMSGIILTSLWRDIHNKPINLDEQVDHYKEYWKRMSH